MYRKSWHAFCIVVCARGGCSHRNDRGFCEVVRKKEFCRWIFDWRIDDRLIHGQVATVWSKQTGVERIIVISDVVAQDKLRKFLLKKLHRRDHSKCNNRAENDSNLS